MAKEKSSTTKEGMWKNTKHALEVRKEVQRRRKSRKLFLREQITREKESQDILRGINMVCGSLFQSPDIEEVTFYVEDNSLNTVLTLLSTGSLLYEYRVDGNMLHIYAKVAG